jgi:hypothetical protein
MLVSCVEIMYIDLHAATIVAVKCDDYERYFAGEQKIIKVTNKRFLNLLNHEIQSLRKSARQNLIGDTRIKVRIVRKGDVVDVLCIGKFYMQLNGEIVEYHDHLKNLVLSQVL